MKLQEISPRQYWRKKFTNTTIRNKKFILCGYQEDLEIPLSKVWVCDETGKIVVNGQKWELFLVSNTPTLDEKDEL